jgi:sugar phosphate isomerase/epimerase
MAKRTVGVQAIIFGQRTKDDLAGVLDEVAAAGFQAVETGYWGGRIGGGEFKKMLDARGLVHVGAHYGGDQMGKLDPVIAWLGETGGTDLPISDLDTRELSPELYQRKADEYNGGGERCRKAGITLSYHNHNWEFGKIGDQLALELLYELTDPNLVKACIDTYWVRDGGGDPAAFVRKHAARLRILHLKDSFLEERGQRSFAPVGEGVLDFPAIAKSLAASPAPWLVVEEDEPRQGKTAAEECTLSRKYVKDVLKF